MRRTGHRDSKKKQVTVPFKALSLAPKKIVTATVLSAPVLLVISLGRISLAHLVLYPENPRFTTSHFLKQKHISKRTPEQNLGKSEPFRQDTCPALSETMRHGSFWWDYDFMFWKDRHRPHVSPVTYTMKPEQRSQWSLRIFFFQALSGKKHPPVLGRLPLWQFHFNKSIDVNT